MEIFNLSEETTPVKILPYEVEYYLDDFFEFNTDFGLNYNGRLGDVNYLPPVVGIYDFIASNIAFDYTGRNNVVRGRKNNDPRVSATFINIIEDYLNISDKHILFYVCLEEEPGMAATRQKLAQQNV